jgi:hypothetical protein
VAANAELLASSVKTNKTFFMIPSSCRSKVQIACQTGSIRNDLVYALNIASMGG